jgi:hypothetical protein
MGLQSIPQETQKSFPQFCQRVLQCQHLPKLPDGYVVDAIYTALDDVPCQSHEQDYKWNLSLSPETHFTTAMIFFNKELVFAWCNQIVHVNRIPKHFIVNFETELGARYHCAVEEEHYEVPIDKWEVTIEMQESFSKLSKQAQSEVRNEIKRQRIDELKQRAFDEAMANRHHVHHQEQSWTRTKEEQQQIDVKQQAFDNAMAER